MSCSLEGCERDATKRGWCDMHYKRWRKHGDPTVTKKLHRAARGTCSMQGCQRTYHSKGLCVKHAGRLRRHGDPSQGGPARIHGSTEDRFWPKVDRSGGPDACWPWTGAIARNGYARFSAHGKSRTAHGVAYELMVGAVEDGLDLDHMCHNADPSCGGGWACVHRRCVNPAHLELTRAELDRRGIPRRRVKDGEQ